MVIRLLPFRWLAVEGQNHWLHRGGQLFDAGVPVTNNQVYALGLKLQDTLGLFGASRIWAFYLRSRGHVDPAYPADRPESGEGLYLGEGIRPWRPAEVFVIWWAGRDFVSDEGDPSYNSTAADPAFYNGRRRYLEVGISHHGGKPDGLSFDAEARFHKVDDIETRRVFDLPFDFSFRLVARFPVDVVLRTVPSSSPPPP